MANKRIFAVSFKHAEGIYCTNVVIAEDAADVLEMYGGYELASAEEIDAARSDELRRRGCPTYEM